ncbi:MAG TPA: YciI family protein [Urbifossiella sp.]|nr:YciI family protein [Urbifossiella sp.]
MKYMMLMYGAEGSWTPEERQECMTQSLKVCDDLAARKKLLAVSPLEPVSTAATVRVRGGKALVTDGPFAETREQLGGFFLLELADLDEAIAVAGKLPPALRGTAEIRPVATLDGLPNGRPIPLGASDSGLEPYILLGYVNPEGSKECGPEGQHKALELARRLDAAGRYLNAAPLHPVSTATSVRVRGGKRQITDGPFAETHEVLGGFFLILAESLEAATQVAAEFPASHRGSVEVRKLFDLAKVRN